MVFKTGELARSKAGHDKDDVYVVIGSITRAGQEMVALADGRKRTVDSPKYKNPIHLQVIHNMITGELTDGNIRHFLESYGGDN